MPLVDQQCTLTLFQLVFTATTEVRFDNIPESERKRERAREIGIDR